MSLREQFAEESIWIDTGALTGIEKVAAPRPLIHEDRLQSVLKRALDLAIAIPLLIVLAPVLAFIALWIAGDTPGPVLFRQTRLGLGGKAFTIVKFRTMTVLENGANVVQATENDPRVTRAGRMLRKSSLDELPQLLNVISGRDVARRPASPHALAHDEHTMPKLYLEGYTQRQSVKPGITGWAQVQRAARRDADARFHEAPGAV